MRPSENLTQLLQFYEAELLERVMPWWMNSDFLDREYGGILQTMADDGTLGGQDKFMWSQGRGLYMFSALYNHIGKRDEWLQVANRVFEFLLPIGGKQRWCWPAWVHRDGSVKQGPDRIYTDGFAIMGMTEYAKATGDERAVEAALATYETVWERMTVPGPHLDVPAPLPQDNAKTHGISMIFSTVFHELGKLVDDAEILQAGYDHALQIMDHFCKPERRLILEHVALDGSEFDTPEGRHVNPGHGIESMWFLIHMFRDRRERARIEQAAERIRWQMEACWDPEYGGMFTILDADGNVPSPDGLKAMWPHNEADYALLLAYEQTGQQWCLDWYDRVHEWTFAYFPMPEYGEWRYRVQRDGSIPEPARADPYYRTHDPFHLPRALLWCIDVLQRLAGE